MTNEPFQPVQDFNRAAGEIMERKLKNREDVPMVADFPLAPEEETPEFRDPAITLQLRGIRALICLPNGFSIMLVYSSVLGDQRTKI
jgi:hypothetical protein